jgi:CRISPR/Cas system CMR-associated protein Cmr5 small subunit
VIAREATEMYKDGKELKEINRVIKEKYSSYGTPTPTPVPE